MELQEKSVSISNSQAIKYGGLVAVAIGINKRAIDRGEDRDYFPGWDAYKDVCADPDFTLLINQDFIDEYRVHYNILVRENDNDTEFTTYFGFVAEEIKSGNYVIVIRGTQGNIEFGIDQLTDPTKFAEYRNINAKVPTGFYSIFEKAMVATLSDRKIRRPAIPLPDFAANLVGHLNLSGSEQVTLLGHSLGSAVATYFAAVAAAGPIKNVNLFLCTFASPMPGDKLFTDTLSKSLKAPLRIYNTEDPVPAEPSVNHSNGQIYSHITGDELTVSSKGDKKIAIDPRKVCAHQLGVYLYLLGASKDPNIIGAGGHKDCQKG